MSGNTGKTLVARKTTAGNQEKEKKKKKIAVSRSFFAGLQDEIKIEREGEDEAANVRWIQVRRRRLQKSLTMKTTMTVKPSYAASKTVYRDSWVDLLAINYLSYNLQAVSGITVEEDGFVGLMETCKGVTYKFSSVQQRQIILDTLKTGFPLLLFPPRSSQVILLFQLFDAGQLKAVIPHTKFIREFLARFTSMLFVWLVGYSEVKESELNGQKEKNVLYIKKCRFLESTNCAGMCTNLCKFPSQTFIKDALGLPINMVPNFEDMSCEMRFGEEPPSLENDPATKQPCYDLCKIRKRSLYDGSYEELVTKLYRVAIQFA